MFYSYFASLSWQAQAREARCAFNINKFILINKKLLQVNPMHTFWQVPAAWCRDKPHCDYTSEF